MARNGGIAEDLFGVKEPKKTTGGMGLIEDTEERPDTDPVDEEEAKKKKALKRKKKLLQAAAKW